MSFRDSERLVSSVLPKGAKPQPAKGCFGKRKDSRGLRGFYDPKSRRRGEVVEFVGEALVEWLMSQERWDEAEAVLDSLEQGGRS